MYAVIKSGGKQYRVKEGDILSVEKLEAEKGQVVDFDQVLLVEDGDKIQVGTPCLTGALVRAEVLETYKDDKVIVFKKKRRKGYRRKKGHRQLLTKVRITGIYPEGSQAVVGEKTEEKKETKAAPKKTRKKEAAKTGEKLTASKTTKPRKTDKKSSGKTAKEE